MRILYAALGSCNKIRASQTTCIAPATYVGFVRSCHDLGYYTEGDLNMEIMSHWQNRMIWQLPVHGDSA